MTRSDFTPVIDLTAEPGRKVVIYGGGNTALDAARTVKRCGRSADHLFTERGGNARR